MQRKRTRDIYSTASVELGTALLPSVRMRKFTMKRLVKYFIFIVIGFFIYSVYEKIQLASKATDSPKVNDGDDFWNKLEQNDKSSVHERVKENPKMVNDGVERRVKAEINKVFQEFKQKQEEKLAKPEQPELKQNVHDIDKNTDDEIFGEKKDIGDNVNDIDIDGGNAEENIVGNAEEFYEQRDDEEEKKDLEVEKEIEERLAQILDETKIETPQKTEVKQEKIEANLNAPAKKVKTRQEEIFEAALLKAEEMEKKQKKEFNAAVQEMGRQLHPLEIKRMNEKAARKKLINDEDHEFPPFVTAVRQTTVESVIQLVASIQQHFPGRKIYVYDLDLTNEDKKKLMALCGVRVRLFMKKLFPEYVSNLDNLHWKPLIMQTALAEFGHITWVNPHFRLGTQELAPLVHESHETGILVIGQSTSYTTYSATHPSMMKFIPSDKEKLSNTPHIEIRAIMIHNTPEVHDNFMKVFTACALEESCLAPKGAKWQCKFDFTGRKPADCHRYDESAINILLKNWFDHDVSKFARKNNYFRPYDGTYKPKLKHCRDVRDIKDSEL